MFPEILKSLLVKTGHTQKDLAAFLGVKQNTVSDWINQGKSPKLAQLSRMSTYFSVSLDYLINGVAYSATNLSSLSKEALDIARRFDALDSLGKRIILNAIEGEELRVEREKCTNKKDTLLTEAAPDLTQTA